VLARFRRQTAKFHLACRILSALRRFASPPWHRWIDWELTFAGGGGALETPSAPASALRAQIGAAARGDRAAFDHASRAGVAFAPHERDLERLRIAIDPSCRLETAEPALGAWLHGALDRAPGGVEGACLDTEMGSDDEATLAYVVAVPGRSARRVMRAGLALVSDRAALGALAARPSQARLDVAAAVLALAGPEGIAPETFFRAAYGFAFVHSRHRSVLDSLVHRLRQRHGGEAEIERTGDALRWITHRTTIVPDPRSRIGVGDRLLRLLAARRRTARAAAQELGVPLRTLQLVLRDLVDDGVCRAHKTGRHVVYLVEDTTFSEPTGARSER